MKKIILYLLALLIIPIAAFGGGTTVVVGQPVASGGSSYQIEETFDGSSTCGGTADTNCDNTSLFSSATGCDLASTNGSPVGTYQLELNNGDQIWWSIAENDETWVTFRFRTEVNPTTNTAEKLIYGYDSSDTYLFELNIRSSNDALYGSLSGGSSLGYCSTTINADTNYWIKFRFKRDTGAANAEFQYWTSSNGTTWTDTQSGNLNLAAETQLSKLRIFNSYSDADSAFYFDNFKSNNSDITDATD